MTENPETAPLVIILWDDKALPLASARGLVDALLEQAGKLGLGSAVRGTQSWGAPDVSSGMTLQVISSARMHHPKPWRLNVAVLPEDSPAKPDNLDDYDVVCRISGVGDLATAWHGSAAGGMALDPGPLSQLVARLVPLIHSGPLARRLEAAQERAFSIASHGPLVSVLLPTHDRLEFLGDAVDSVLAQSYTHWELVVVQDGGPDVAEILAARPDPRIKLLVQEQNLGKGAALNLALEQAQGGYIAYLDDDDIWLPNHLEALMRVLATTPGVRMVHSDSHRLHRRWTASGWEVDASSRSLPYSGHISLEDILEHNAILGITVAHDRDLIQEAGPFDECLETLVDFDMWRRLAARTHPCHVSQVTAEYFVWAKDDPRRSQMTGLPDHDLPRYLANKARILSKPLPEFVPEELRQQWGQLRRSVRHDFLLQRGMHFLRNEQNKARAVVSLKLARKFCPASADARRVLAIAFLEAGAASACLELMQQNLASVGRRRPPDFFYASLANLQLGQALKVLPLLESLEREFSLNDEERGLVRRYRSLAQKAAQR